MVNYGPLNMGEIIVFRHSIFGFLEANVLHAS